MPECCNRASIRDLNGGSLKSCENDNLLTLSCPELTLFEKRPLLLEVLCRVHVYLSLRSDSSQIETLKEGLLRFFSLHQNYPLTLLDNFISLIMDINLEDKESHVRTLMFSFLNKLSYYTYSISKFYRA